MGNLLDIQNLSVGLPLPTGILQAVRDVTLSLNKGETLGIVGESGSGKSMTALALMQLLPRGAQMQATDITFDGIDLLTMPPERFTKDYLGPRIGMIFQEPMTSLNPVYTIGRQMTEAVEMRGALSGRAAKERAIQLLERVGLPDPAGRMRQYPHQLSGGQRQRVMIAMALMSEPELLIADEPTTALDVTVQAQILDLLDDLRRELNMAMILISHDLAVVAERTDHVMVMYGGEVAEQGRTAAVMRKPTHPYTRALLAAIPRLDGAPRRLEAIPGTVPSIMSRPAGCVFAPRCAFRQDTCDAERPPVQGNEDHSYRCVLEHAPPAQAAPPLAKTRHIATDADSVISAESVTQIYKARKTLFSAKTELRAVDDVSLTLKRGETLAVVGESGSGKSTLARIMLGLSRPTHGAVKMLGRPVGDLSPQERATLVQPVFQDPYSSLNPRHTLADTIAWPLALRSEGSADDRLKRVREVMDLVRLPDRLLHSYPSQLSGGQRQRVAIARALISHPEALICDEPTSALDVSVQVQILNLLSDLQEQMNLSCLIITHDMAVVHQIADRVAVMLNGKIVEQGPAHDVLHNPKTAYTTSLLAAAPRFARQDQLETSAS